MDQKSSYFIPVAILFAGVIIAGAIIYTDQVSKNKIGDDTKENKIIELSDGGNIVLGNSQAKVAIVEFSDFQCPFCGRFFKNVLPAIKEKYINSGKVKFIYRDFAFLGEESMNAALAARCAGEQDKYWAYHDKLFENQKGENKSAFSGENLKKFAAELGLRLDLFNLCFESGKFKDKIENDLNAAKEVGVSGTPTVFIGILPIKVDTFKIKRDSFLAEFENGTMIVGAQPLKVYEEAIEKYLK